MKILIFNKYCPRHPLAGGAEARLREVMRRIVKEGHEIHLLCARFPGSRKEEYAYGMHIHRIGSENSCNTVMVHLLGVLKARTFIRKISPDILLEDISPLPWFMPIITKKPKVVIIHHLNEGVFFQSQNFLFALFAYLLEKSMFIFYKNQKIITINDYVAGRLLKSGFKRENIVLVHDGVDAKKYQPNKKLQAKFPSVLFLGRLEKRKGADLLIRTYDLVKKEIPNVKYYITGDGKERKKLESLAKGKKDIIFKGFLEEKQKIKQLQSSWILAAPSRAEGYGLAVLEANACGIPAIANNVPGLRDSVKNGKTGFIVNCSDRNAFSEKILMLLKYRRLREKLGKEARIWAEKHSWEETAEKTLKALKEQMEISKGKSR